MGNQELSIDEKMRNSFGFRTMFIAQHTPLIPIPHTLYPYPTKLNILNGSTDQAEMFGSHSAVTKEHHLIKKMENPCGPISIICILKPLQELKIRDYQISTPKHYV